MKPNLFRGTAVAFVVGLALHVSVRVDATGTTSDELVGGNQVLEWNQIFIDTLIATNTPNSFSQRFGAIVHTAIFDAYNGIERRFAPISCTTPPRPGHRAELPSSLLHIRPSPACSLHAKRR